MANKIDKKIVGYSVQDAEAQAAEAAAAEAKAAQPQQEQHSAPYQAASAPFAATAIFNKVPDDSD